MGSADRHSLECRRSGSATNPWDRTPESKPEYARRENGGMDAAKVQRSFLTNQRKKVMTLMKMKIKNLKCSVIKNVRKKCTIMKQGSGVLLGMDVMKRWIEIKAQLLYLYIVKFSE
jgi:hypothetical protein